MRGPSPPGLPNKVQEVREATQQARMQVRESRESSRFISGRGWAWATVIPAAPATPPKPAARLK